MKRTIIDYKKLTPELLNKLVEKFPYGYNDEDIIRFKNAQGELIKAIEIETDDTDYLVKVSKGLATSIENFDDQDLEDEKLDLEFEDDEFDED
ncbi:MAG: hypothetical protein WBV45_01385 [Lutimonas sp.]